ncbi:MAG: hypothetical protein Tsb0027_03080 [Wenzhouxiangellaceae bacterium]
MNTRSKIALGSFLATISLLTIANEPEFQSVEEVYEYLRSADGVSIRTEQGWTIAEQNEDMALWSFTTEGHPAHPAVFMRQVVIDKEQISLRTWGICEAEKEACDMLSAEFEKLNQNIREQMGISDASQ